MLPGFLVHLSNFIHVSPELVNHIVRVQQLRLFAKTQNPAEELVADLHLGGHTEVGIIHLGILDILCAEAVNHRIQERIDEANLHELLFAAVHGENSFGVGFQVICLNSSSPSLGSPCEADVPHAVNSVN